MTGYRSGYGNPLNVLLFRERVTCKGCIYKADVWGLSYCLKDEKKVGKKMTRCLLYTTGDNK